MTAISDLADAYQALLIRDDPVYAVVAGTAPQSVAPVDDKAVQDRAAVAQQMLDRLEVIDVDPAEADLASVLRHLLVADIDQAHIMWHDHPTAPYHANFLIGTIARMAIAPLTGPERLRLTAEFAECIRSVARVLRDQRKRGIALPGPAAEGARTTWAALGAELHTLLGDSAVDAAMTAVAAQIDEAAATAGDAVALAHLPGGEKAYRVLVRQYTTLDLAPEELHQLGLEQCAELAERMAEIRARLGGPGNEEEARAWLAAQHHLHAPDPDAVAATYRRHLARVEPGISALFRHQPRAAYGVQRLDRRGRHDRADFRTVHQAMLAGGSVPLPRMRQRVAQAVQQETASARGIGGHRV